MAFHHHTTWKHYW